MNFKYGVKSYPVLVLLAFILPRSVRANFDPDEGMFKDIFDAYVKSMGVGDDERVAAAFIAIAEKYPNSPYADDSLLYAEERLPAEDCKAVIAVYDRILKGKKSHDGSVQFNCNNWWLVVGDLVNCCIDVENHNYLSESQFKILKSNIKNLFQALRVYAAYMSRYPDSTIDNAKCTLAYIYKKNPETRPKAVDLLKSIEPVPPLEEKILEVQDKLFSQRLYSGLLSNIKSDSSFAGLRPVRELNKSIRMLKESLGIEEKSVVRGFDEESINKTATERIEEFFRHTDKVEPATD